jgi:uncharacterized membrane protein HdeD (DUF308 family)
MNSKMLFENSKTFYILGLLSILIGLILINLDFNLLDHSLLEIGIVLLVLGLNEAIKTYLSYFGQNLVETV